MGDRGNIKLTGGPDFPTPVCIYTHWGGSEMKYDLAHALARGRSRWGDPSYLGRIIFCELVKDSVRDLTGFGLSADLGDNEYPVLVVDMDKKTVHEEPDTRKGFGYQLRADSIKEPMPFDDFIAKYAVKETEAV